MTAAQEPAGGCCEPANTAAPIACSLDGDNQKARVQQWQAALAGVRDREAIANGVRLVFAPTTSPGEIASLAAAEHACCPFFSFTLTIDHRGTALEVTAPDDGRGVLDALFGPEP